MTEPRDVRMKGFPPSVDLEAALAILAERVRPLATESVAMPDALGRVLAEDVIAPRDVPSFARCAVDGYAVRAEDTFGAGPFDARALALVGEALPGRASPRAVGPGEAVRVMTGAPAPEGADAVVMVEHAEEKDGQVRVFQPIAPRKNLAARGEDVKEGEIVAARGRRLRPEDVGLLASIRRRTVVVHRRPSVVIWSSGNELIDPLSELEATDTSVFDANGYTLEALAKREGVPVRRAGILADDRDTLRGALAQPGCDVSITSGAASVGKHDLVPLLVQELGELWVHGVAMRPAHPTGFGRIGDRLHFILPGNPVAAWLAFVVFVRPALRLLEGEPRDRAFAKVTRPGRLAKKITSVSGRTDFVRVTIDAQGMVVPSKGAGASALTTLTRAHGLVVVPKALEGLEAGTDVEVELL